MCTGILNVSAVFASKLGDSCRKASALFLFRDTTGAWEPSRFLLDVDAATKGMLVSRMGCEGVTAACVVASGTDASAHRQEGRIHRQAGRFLFLREVADILELDLVLLGLGGDGVTAACVAVSGRDAGGVKSIDDSSLSDKTIGSLALPAAGLKARVGLALGFLSSFSSGLMDDFAALSSCAGAPSTESGETTLFEDSDSFCDISVVCSLALPQSCCSHAPSCVWMEFASSSSDTESSSH